MKFISIMAALETELHKMQCFCFSSFFFFFFQSFCFLFIYFDLIFFSNVLPGQFLSDSSDLSKQSGSRSQNQPSGIHRSPLSHARSPS